MDYLTDERYPWVAICEREFGVRLVQILFEENSIAHLAEFEDKPSVRPFTREELVVFFDFCDERVRELRRLRRKGSLAAFARRGAVQDDLCVRSSPTGGREA